MVEEPTTLTRRRARLGATGRRPRAAGSSLRRLVALGFRPRRCWRSSSGSAWALLGGAGGGRTAAEARRAAAEAAAHHLPGGVHARADGDVESARSTRSREDKRNVRPRLSPLGYRALTAGLVPRAARVPDRGAGRRTWRASCSRRRTSSRSEDDDAAARQQPADGVPRGTGHDSTCATPARRT